jgi:mRNA interferase RelE/StbE
VTYRVELTRRAQKQVQDLTQTMRRRIDAKLLNMEDDPYAAASKLTAIHGFRIRVGDYRILYEVDDKKSIVLVNQILHRREAYR